MSQEKIYQLALFNIPSVGGVIFRQLLSYCGSAESVYKHSKGKLEKVPGIGSKLAKHILGSFDLDKAHKDFERAEKESVRILFFTDDDYPERLRNINDAPPILFYKGNVSLNAKRIISIVGTRSATRYGLQVTGQLVNELKAHSAMIVSGLAYGIDVESHKQCMKNEMPTIGVMASGLNIIYPAVHRSIAAKMTENGGLLTEYSFDIKPDGPQFPARNRLIAGISDATVVIEAAERGGALITAELANGYDREVFAVPGTLYAEYSKGCNNLIKRHKARILTSGDDIADILNWDIDQKQEKLNRQLILDLDKEEKKVYDLFTNGDPLPIDLISGQSDIHLSHLSGILLNLEFKGLIKSLPGKQYVRSIT